MDEEQRRIEILENDIKYYANRYYNGNPECSDEYFDSLVDELRQLKPNSEVINRTGWGYEPDGTIGLKVNHKYQKMGSLPKTREWNGIPDMFKDGTAIAISQKLDGLSAVAYYKDGEFVQGITRGNGEVGIDITDKLKRMVPEQIDKFTGAVRGELIIPIDKWKVMKEKNPDLISSRNTAAGIINRKELTNDLDNVVLCVYKVVGCEGDIPFNNVLEMREFLKQHFSNVVTTEYPILENEDFWNLHASYTFENMKQKGYEIDGLVLTKNEFRVESNGAIIYDEFAYKFASETATSKVRYIDWKLSRTQRLIPTVEIEPVELSGAIIKRASGFNAKYIDDNKIDTGAVIEIMRSGEVIPDIQSVVEESKEFNLPEFCPECESELEWNGVDLICTNPDCPNIAYSDMMAWINSIGTKYIDGLGQLIIESWLADNDHVTNLKNLYELPIGGIDVSTATGKKLDLLADRLFFNDIDIVDALCGLNIPRLGMTTAVKLAEDKELCNRLISYGLFKEISTNNVDKLKKIVGNATAESIINNPNKLLMLSRVERRLVYPEKKEPVEVIGTFCVTGKLNSMKRDDLVKLAESKGWKALGGVNKDCNYLVTNDTTSGSSKNKKAQELGTKIITEDEFLNLIK